MITGIRYTCTWYLTHLPTRDVHLQVDRRGDESVTLQGALRADGLAHEWVAVGLVIRLGRLALLLQWECVDAHPHREGLALVAIASGKAVLELADWHLELVAALGQRLKIGAPLTPLLAIGEEQRALHNDPFGRWSSDRESHPVVVYRHLGGALLEQPHLIA